MPELSLSTWTQVERYLERNQTIVVPIGSTEQHGPNGLIGTDWITADEIARKAGDASSVMVAPVIPVGMALHHLAFPGTISYRPETLMAVLRDYVESLFLHGFRRFIFVNGHGGNTATGSVAFSALRQAKPDAELVWVNWYMTPSVRAYCREHFGDREGQHATPSEISVTMACRPGAVVPVDGPLSLDDCALRGIPAATKFREYYPDGRMASDPSLATEAHGKALVKLAISDLVAAIA